MEEYTCVACGEDATEGFAIGRLCYHCIEEAVTHIIRQKNKEDKETK
ncbi:hypothetical protein LIS82_08810 [Cytobacillus solani]|nr:hypothetical protein [Cytobacillus solani]USK56552.1 hypothetical protein LIS82_08810 [Cytobacillus solani]